MNRNNIRISEHKLTNGLKILFYPCMESPSATFMVWYKVGSRNEIAGKTGISHFLEHLSFKRTELFDYGQIIYEINRNGGNFNAYTSRDFTCYYETFISSELELAMIIESQRMHKLILDENDRKTEVGIILSELEKGLNNPYLELEKATRLTAYKKHPYKNPIIGEAEDVRNIKIQDLREYYNDFYKPNNATIVVVGNFNTKEALQLIKKHFENIKYGLITTCTEKEPEQTRLRRINIAKECSYSLLKLAFHIPCSVHEDIFPLIVLGEMFNSGVSSRMNEALIEKQIATNVNTNVEMARDSGLFTVMATLYPNISHKTAEDIIFYEINNIYRGKIPTKEELEKTKKRIKCSFEFNRDGTLKLAYLIGYYETINNYKMLENYLYNIDKVTIEDIKRVVKLYLNKNNCTIGYFIPEHRDKKKISYIQECKIPVQKQPEINYMPIISRVKTSLFSVNFLKNITENGIKVLISQNKTSDTVKLCGTIYAGNLYSNMVNPSLPIICGSMLNKGTKSRTKLEIATNVEEKGASVGISNVTEAVNFSLSCIKEDFECLLRLLSEILTEPSFPEDEFEKLKKFFIAGIKQRKNNSDFLANMYFKRMIFPKNHPWYTFSNSTQEKHINSLPLEDIKYFYNRFYAPNNTIIAISGNVEAEQTFRLIDYYFNKWQNKEIILPKTPTPKLQDEYIQKIIPVRGKTETKIIFGHYGNVSRSHPDYHKALIMNFILGGSGALTSRIGKKLREEMGLVYSISSNFNTLSIPGGWSVRFGIDDSCVDIAINTLKSEIKRFVEEGISVTELDLAKSYNAGTYPLRFTNNNGIAKTLLINEFYGLGDNYINEYQKIIDSITKNQVEEAAKKYLHPDKASVVIVRNT